MMSSASGGEETLVQRQILLLLLHDAPNKRDSLREAYRLLVADANRTDGGKPLLPPELYVRCAEAALGFQILEVADRCLYWFFCGRHVYSQWLCRAFYSRARLEAFKSATARGEKAQNMILSSLAFLTRGMEAVRRQPCYSFLIYNGSVLFWQLSRPLNNDGTRQLLIPGLKNLIKALEEVNEPDLLWRARLNMHLARALDEGHHAQEAVAAANLSLSLCNSCKVKDNPPVTANLRAEAFRLAIHVARNSPEAFSRLRNDSSVAGGGPLRPLFMLQALISGAVRDPGRITSDLKELLTILRAGNYPLLLAELGLTALMLNSPDISQSALEGLEECKLLKVRVMTDLLRCQLGFSRLKNEMEERLPGSSECVGPSVEDAAPFKSLLATLANSMELSLRAFAESQRLRGSGGVHSAGNIICVGEYPSWALILQDLALTTWNIAIPLVQCHPRAAKKALQGAAMTMEDIKSSKGQFRARLHYQLAQAEVVDDMLAKAETHIRKAISLNTDHDFLVRRLSMLARRIELRTDIYADESTHTILERAYLRLEKARQVTASELSANSSISGEKGQLVISQLRDTLALLEEDGSERDMRAELLHSSMVLAHSLGLHDLLLIAAKQYLKTKWRSSEIADGEEIDPTVAEREAWRVQAFYFQALALGSRGQSSDQESVLSKLLSGLRLAMRLRDDVLAQNGIVHVWNYCLPQMRARQWQSIIKPLQECFQCLEKIEKRDTILAGQLCTTLARGISEFCQARKNAAVTPSSSVPSSPHPFGPNESLPSTGLGAVGRREKAQSELKLGEDVCKWALTLNLDPQHRKELLALQVRLARLRGSSGQAASKGMDTKTVLVLLVETIQGEVSEVRKRDAMPKALEMLEQTQSTDIDLHALVALEALSIQDADLASRVARRGASLLPQESESDFPQHLLFWSAMCLSIVGHAAAMQTQRCDSSGTQVTGKTQFAFEAVRYFALASERAARAKQLPLVDQSLGSLWNASIILSGDAITRKLLITPVQTVLESARQAKSSSFGVIVKLYKLLFACFIDQQLHQEGLQKVEEAFSWIPREQHNTIWEAKIIFLSGCRSDRMTPAVFTIKQDDTLLQARVYLLLAHKTQELRDQGMWYQRAIAVLEGFPFSRIEAMLEYAGWLYGNGSSYQETVQALRSTLCLAHSLEDQHMRRQRVFYSRSVTVDDNVSVFSAVSSRAPRTGKLKAITPRASPKSERPPSSASSSTTRKSKTFRRMEVQIKAYILFARVLEARSVHRSLELYIHALHYLIGYWELLCSEAQVAFPTCLRDWIYITPAPAIFELLQPDGGMEGLVSEPKVLLWYVDYLRQALERHGCLLHTLPLFVFLDVASVIAYPSSSLNALLRSLYHLRRAAVFEQLLLIDQFSQARGSAGTLVPSPEFVRDVLVEVRQRNEVAELAERASTSKRRFRSSVRSTASPGRVGEFVSAEVHTLWKDIAHFLVEDGDYMLAKELLANALHRARAFDDLDCQAWCLHLQAVISSSENRLEEALELEKTAMNAGGDSTFWSHLLPHLSRLYAKLDKEESQEVLENALTSFESMGTGNSPSSPDLLRLRGFLCTKLAKLFLRDADSFVVAGLDPSDRLEQSFSYYSKAVECFRQLGEALSLVKALLGCCTAVLNRNKPDPHGAVMKERDLLLEARDVAQARLKLALAMPVPPGASLPLARQLGKVYQRLGRTELQLSKLQKDEVHSEPDPVELLFLSYEPPKTLSFYAPSPQSALVYLSASKSLCVGQPALDLALGRGLFPLLLESDRPWDEIRTSDTEEEISIVSSPHVYEASNLLDQALSASISAEQFDVAASAAFYLAQLLGPTALQRTAQYLLMAQSCLVALNASRLLAETLQPHSAELLNLQLRRKLRKSRPAFSQLSSVTSGADLLANFSPCWPLIDNLPVESVLAECSGSTALLSLCHNPDDNYLYMTFIPPSEGHGAVSMLPVIVRSRPDASLWESLLATVDEVCSLFYRFEMLKAEDVRKRGNGIVTEDVSLSSLYADVSSSVPVAPQQQRGRRGRGRSSDPPALTTSAVVDTSTNVIRTSPQPLAVDTALIEALSAMTIDLGVAVEKLCCDTELFLQPVLSGIESNLRFSRLVLLPDRQLSVLPLEMLSTINNLADSVVRDFSLHTLYVRQRKQMVTSSHGHIQRQRSSQFSFCDKFSYIVDPLAEDTVPVHFSVSADDCRYRTVSEHFTSQFLQPVRRHGTAATHVIGKGWDGITGGLHIPSIEEWQNCLLHSAGVWFLGFEPIFQTLSVRHFTALNFEGCLIALLADRSVNAGSRRGVCDGIPMENLTPYDTALLLSLRGVKCVVQNQWFCTPWHNLAFYGEIVEQLSVYSRSIGEALGTARQAVRSRTLERKMVSSLVYEDRVSSPPKESPEKDENVEVEEKPVEASSPSQQQPEEEPTAVSRESHINVLLDFISRNAVTYGLLSMKLPRRKIDN